MIDNENINEQEYPFTLREVAVIQIALKCLMMSSKEDSEIHKRVKSTYEKVALITGITIESLQEFISSHI